MRNRAAQRTDYDSPWKEFLTLFFKEFLALVLPELHQQIDWSKPVQFLDNELRRLTPHSETGRLYTDCLVKVHLLGGKSQAILAHVEAQSQFQSAIEERVFTYYARIWLQLRLPIVSIVIYADKNPNWRPNRYVQELPGTRLDFQFQAVKLLDLDEGWLETQARTGNPAALMLLAFRRAMATEADSEARLAARLQLVRLTFEFGYDIDTRAHLLRLMEWILMLPEILEQQVEELVEQYKRERRTTFVSRMERRAIREGLQQGLEQGLQQGLQQGLEQGLQQGLQQGLEQGLQQGLQQGLHAMQSTVMRVLRRRFGEDAEQLSELLAQVNSVSVLEQLLDLALDVPSLEAFETQLQAACDAQEQVFESEGAPSQDDF